jgi:subtilisin family serine protease
MSTDLELIDGKTFDAATGKSVRVLVVDSGVETDHPAVRDCSIACYQVDTAPTGRLRVSKDDGTDVFGHGTAVAAIIHKFAPDARIDSLRVLGGDLRATSQHFLTGLEWGIKQGYDVINCSLGSTNEQFVAGYKRLVDQAFCRNSLLIGACNNSDFQTLDYPSSFPTVISTDFGKLDGLAFRRRAGELVEFIARGEQIRVAWKNGGWRTTTGSSFAAPHLCAVVVRIRQHRPSWNVCEIKAALYRMATS